MLAYTTIANVPIETINNHIVKQSIIRTKILLNINHILIRVVRYRLTTTVHCNVVVWWLLKWTGIINSILPATEYSGTYVASVVTVMQCGNLNSIHQLPLLYVLPVKLDNIIAVERLVHDILDRFIHFIVWSIRLNLLFFFVRYILSCNKDFYFFGYHVCCVCHGYIIPSVVWCVKPYLLRFWKNS